MSKHTADAVGPDSSAVQFLTAKAEEVGVDLPPLGKTPRRWPKVLQAPRDDPGYFGDTRGQFLKSVAKHARGAIVLQTVALSVGTVLGALLPFVLGKGIDAAISDGLSAPTWQWIGLFTVMILVMSIGDGVNQMGEIAAFLRGSLGSARVVAHRVSRAGRAAKQDKPAGDVVTGIINDSARIGEAVLFVAEVISSILAIAVVTVAMYSMSTVLATMVIIGLPIALAGIGVMVKPLEKKVARMRAEQGTLTTISTDAVSGLRVLRGVGGEKFYNSRYKRQSQKVKDAGIAMAHNQAALTVMRTALPQLFIAVITGYGAFLTFRGQITAGDLVAFAGMTAYLSTPFNVAGQAAYVGTRAWVGAKKLAEFSSVEPPTSDAAVPSSKTLLEDEDDLLAGPAGFAGAPLTDVQSGIAVKPGILTAVVSKSPAQSAELAKRLARVSDEYEVRSGDRDLRTFPLAQVRKSILLSEADAQLFRGTIHAVLRGAAAVEPLPRGVTELVYRERIEEESREEGSLFRPDRVPEDARLYEAMNVADAQDVLESVPGGMAGWLSERGRNLSGGQRQRVALARALYQDAPVLVAIEPTSAVDSHSEERISGRVRDARAGKTTLVVTASPLWLDKCDEVIVLGDDGLEVARGSHNQLKRSAEAGDKGAILYRQIIEREAGGDSEASGR